MISDEILRKVNEHLRQNIGNLMLEIENRSEIKDGKLCIDTLYWLTLRKRFRNANLLVR